MSFRKLYIALLFFNLGGVALAQTATRPSPDCLLSYSLTSAASSATLTNVPQLASGSSTGGCTYWIVTSDQFNTGVGTLVFESSATSTAAGTAPNSFITFAGTTIAGSNPTSTFPWTYVASGYYPWVRVTASAYTSGTLRGIIQGWRELPSSGSGGGSSTITNLAVCQNSSNTLNRAVINFTTATTTQIVAASGSTSITLCSLALAANGTTNVNIVYGTGSNCGTGTNNVTGSNGGFQSVLAVALDQPLPLPASQAFCLQSSAAVTIGGFVTYVQQ